jgi:hypothetical protein
MYEVPKAKGGGTRKTTIRDARKHGWYPSVTSILKIVDKPFLNAWIANQAIEACMKVSENKVAYIIDASGGMDMIPLTESDLPEIKRLSDEVSKEAREKGTEYHRAIEKVMGDYAAGKSHNLHGLPRSTYEALLVLFRKHRLKPTALEKSFANKRYGYGGRVDFEGTGRIRDDFTKSIDGQHRMCTIDYKTQNTKGKGTFVTYGETKCQLAAYAAGTGRAMADLGTIFIDTSMDGNVELVYHPDNDQYFIDFLAAFRLWKTETLGKNYEV